MPKDPVHPGDLVQRKEAPPYDGRSWAMMMLAIQITAEPGNPKHRRYQKMTVLPPIGKQDPYPALQLTVIHAHERDVPPGRAGIEWKLLTNLPVRSRAQAIGKLDW